MRSSQRARVHLRLLSGGDYPPGISGSPPDMSGSPATRVWLGPGAWALVPGGYTQALRPSAIRDMLARFDLTDADRSGARYQITRVQPVAMVPWLGLALLHHTGSRTVLYCRSDQIAPQAADCLAALAARAAEVAGTAAAGSSCQVIMARVRHGDLPADLHPAVTTIRGSQITAHVCSRLITHELAVAMAAIGAGFGSLPVPAGSMRARGQVPETRPLAMAGRDGAGQG